MHSQSRREFLKAVPAALLPATAALAGTKSAAFPMVDYHVHLNAFFSLDDAVTLSKQRGVKFGIAEHAGTKENGYRGILTNDEELLAWLAKLEGKPVYKGIQAEWIDWWKCFSKPAIAKLDYVLSDAMTMPGPHGERVKMWGAGFDPGDPQAFMERYVKWNVEVITKEPLDIFAHPTWLPPPRDKDYDRLWTAERMRPIITALKQTRTAVEIDSAYQIPRMPFLKMAKSAGLKFSFGSNSGSGPVRAMDFCTDTAKELDLSAKDMFVPTPKSLKPIYRRKLI
jgi:histidinol phosphatase-like PHP family hydrolase